MLLQEVASDSLLLSVVVLRVRSHIGVLGMIQGIIYVHVAVEVESPLFCIQIFYDLAHFRYVVAS